MFIICCKVSIFSIWIQFRKYNDSNISIIQLISIVIIQIRDFITKIRSRSIMQCIFCGLSP